MRRSPYSLAGARTPLPQSACACSMPPKPARYSAPLQRQARSSSAFREAPRSGSQFHRLHLVRPHEEATRPARFFIRPPFQGRGVRAVAGIESAFGRSSSRGGWKGPREALEKPRCRRLVEREAVAQKQLRGEVGAHDASFRAMGDAGIDCMNGLVSDDAR